MPFRRVAALFFLASTAALVAKTSSAYHPKKGSEILWDKFGVPHVFLKTVPDMFYLFGYAEVEAHVDLLLRTIGDSRGRGAEYFGPGYQDANLRTSSGARGRFGPRSLGDWYVDTCLHAGIIDHTDPRSESVLAGAPQHLAPQHHRAVALPVEP
jgi:hypothetical protein